MAELVSTRSTWPRTKVGCVVTVDGIVLSTGYNGTPKGWDESQETTKRHYCHAEENAIVQAARNGVALVGATFYTSMSPCLSCARMMVNVGAERVVFARRWDDPEAQQALEVLAQCGVRYDQIQEVSQ
jgi:dCMP deaminase